MADHSDLERIFRKERGRALSVLISRLGDIDLAEDALQDDFVAALDRWPEEGVPDHPAAWIIRTARRKAVDQIRRRRNFDAKRTLLAEELTAQHAAEADQEEEDAFPDERLRLIFTCCHPALSQEARLALTLKTVAGLATAEIAHAFLVPETTMAQRLVRAKRKIKEAGIPYRTPPPTQWAERLDAVLAVIYLIFNEGYAATTGRTPTRTDLCREAIRLGDIVQALAPREPEAAGLLALMLLHDARRSARTDGSGRLVTLAHQDRGLWAHEQIERGLALLEAAAGFNRIGPFQIQAAISAEHTRAERYETTNWRRITQLYDALYALQPSPVVKLNGAVALSMAGDPDAGLRTLAALEADGRLSDYQPFHAARADLLVRAGRPTEAIRAYERALALTRNEADRFFLEERLRRALDAGEGDP